MTNVGINLSIAGDVGDRDLREAARNCCYHCVANLVTNLERKVDKGKSLWIKEELEDLRSKFDRLIEPLEKIAAVEENHLWRPLLHQCR